MLKLIFKNYERSHQLCRNTFAPVHMFFFKICKNLLNQIIRNKVNFQPINIIILLSETLKSKMQIQTICIRKKKLKNLLFIT